jgi:hypothetical protein
MAYTPTTPELGIQPFAQAAATGTVNHPLGTIVEGYDPTFGGGKFIYLYGVAANTVGSLVTYNQLTGITTLAATTGGQDRPLAVSMNANTSITTGSWYQVSGAAVVKKTAVKIATTSSPVYLAGSGRVTGVASAGKQVVNATAISATAATVASATSTVTLNIQFPFAQGQIT